MECDKDGVTDMECDKYGVTDIGCDKDGVLVHTLPRKIEDLNMELHYYILPCPSLEYGKKLWLVLSKLSTMGFVAMVTPLFQCTDGVCVGLLKEKSGRSDCGTLAQVIQNSPQTFFDTYERRNMVTLNAEMVKVQPSLCYIGLLKAVIGVLEALEESDFSVILGLNSILLTEYGGVRFIGFELSKTKEGLIQDFSTLIDKISSGVGEDRGLMTPFKDELNMVVKYKTLLEDPTLMIPQEKIRFMMELGGFLESKSLQKEVSREPYSEKHNVVFNTFLELSENDYYLRWLVHANDLTGFRKLPHSSYYEPVKDNRREDRSHSWILDKEQSTQPQVSATKPEGNWRDRLEAKKKNAAVKDSDFKKGPIFPQGSISAQGSVTRKCTREAIIYISKLFRNSYAHDSNLVLVFKKALGFKSLEDLQLIFEMLFPGHVRQLTFLHEHLKDKHAAQSEIALWDGSHKQMPVKPQIAKGRPHTWSELKLQKEIEVLQKQNLGSQQECLDKEAKLAHDIQALDDSIHYGLK